MSLDPIRERINIFLYGTKEKVLRAGRFLNLIVSLLSIVVLIYYYGFPHSPEEQDQLLMIIKGSFAFYVLHYLIRIVYDFSPLKFIQNSWFEGLLMLLLVVEAVSYNLSGTLLVEALFQRFGVTSFTDLRNIFIQVYFFSVVWIELKRLGPVLPRFKVHPSVIFIFSFSALIFGGTGLLMLPEMTTVQGSMNFLDAFFTSTSATCVTGLMVEDTPNFFTFKGQFVLLILIKLGGLNIIAFGSFLALAAKFGLSVKQHDSIEDFVNRETSISATGMLTKVVVWSTAIELLGTVLMYVFWDDAIPFTSNGERWFFSIFHSVSAFNNAGISLFSGGLGDPLVANNYYVHWIVTILVFFGALGMMAVFNLFDPKELRNRLKHPWKQITFSTKIALYYSIGLVAVGAILYFVLENQNTMAGQSVFGKVTTAVFQSVTRTSGFNTVDIGSIGVPMLFVLVILMFIGSSSSSTGGGIKTSTFAIISANVLATIQGKSQTTLYKRSISYLLISRAYSVLLFFVVGNLICTFLLCITESHILAQEGRNILDLMFEQVSAMGTVGLSTGITSELSAAGKIIIAVSMFVGRVGTLTVAFAVTRETISKNYKYPEGHTMVG
jgi:trk system potassium uptake protein TrkH